jgi:hypothetical protein
MFLVSPPFCSVVWCVQPLTCRKPPLFVRSSYFNYSLKELQINHLLIKIIHIQIVMNKVAKSKVNSRATKGKEQDEETIN